MISQNGGTKTIDKTTKRIVELDGKILINAMIPHIKTIRTLSVGSLCAMVFKVGYDNKKMPYELRSQEIGENGHPVAPLDVYDATHGKLHDSVVLKISLVHNTGTLLVDNYDDVHHVVHRKSTVTPLDTLAEWTGQRYIHETLRSTSGVSPCPDAIGNVKYDQTEFSAFCSSVRSKLLKDADTNHVFNYLSDQLVKYPSLSIDILIMDSVPGRPLALVDARHIGDMSNRCGAIYATVVAKTGFAAADGHNRNWLVDIITKVDSITKADIITEVIIAMIDFGRGSYLLVPGAINKLMAGLEQWLNDPSRDMSDIISLWRCLGQGSPVGMTWKEWFKGIATLTGPAVLQKIHMQKITTMTIRMMSKVLHSFITELSIGVPTCPAFIISPINPERKVCENLHRLFVLTALCGGLFHAIDYDSTPIQFEALARIYDDINLTAFDRIIANVNIDLGTYERTNPDHHLKDVCHHMQPLITARGFETPRYHDLSNPTGADGIIEQARKAIIEQKKKEALEAASMADNKSLQRHRSKAPTHRPIKRSRSPSRSRSSNSHPSSPPPPPSRPVRQGRKTGAFSPNRRHTPHGGRIKRRTNRTKHRRQHQHTRKLRN